MRFDKKIRLNNFLTILQTGSRFFGCFSCFVEIFSIMSQRCIHLSENVDLSYERCSVTLLKSIAQCFSLQQKKSLYECGKPPTSLPLEYCSLRHRDTEPVMHEGKSNISYLIYDHTQWIKWRLRHVDYFFFSKMLHFPGLLKVT